MANEGRKNMKKSDVILCCVYVIITTFKLVDDLILSHKVFARPKIFKVYQFTNFSGQS